MKKKTRNKKPGSSAAKRRDYKESDFTKSLHGPKSRKGASNVGEAGAAARTYHANEQKRRTR